jgi:hypothetical protein
VLGSAGGVVGAMAPCGHVAGSGCAGVAAPWVCWRMSPVCCWWCVCRMYCVISVVG